MALLLLFAFLAGFFTILSPCILPILPAILSGGTAKGKWRPLGMILGLIVSFSFFTLTLTLIVHATGLSANVLRYIAIAIIAFFGAVMIFPGLSNWFAGISAPVANWGQGIQSGAPKKGFWGGVLFGVALGLLWTPCAGPILAAITTLVATQSISLGTVLVTLAYSLGAGIPLFLIAYGGQKIIQSSRFLSGHAEGIRQFFGALMIVTALALLFHWDMWVQQRIATWASPIMLEDNPLVKKELNRLLHQTGMGEEPQIGQKAPEWRGITNWINSKPLSLMDLKGKVVLVDFWTYSCINCLRTLPYIERWYRDYKDKGLVVIGVHTPEFEFEKDPRNVADAAMRLGVLYPVAQDNDYATWNAYHNHYWPAHYLIDQNGILRSTHFGEGGYVETENEIRALLGMSKLEMKEPLVISLPHTSETYLGTARADRWTKEIQLVSNQTASYHYQPPLSDDQVGMQGAWRVETERITSESDESTLDLNFLAKKVYLVLSGSSTTPIVVTLDGKKAAAFAMDGDRKYDIVDTAYGRHLLSLKIPKGVSAYAFTFGD